MSRGGTFERVRCEAGREDQKKRSCGKCHFESEGPKKKG
jgi:hypothetical protein